MFAITVSPKLKSTKVKVVLISVICVLALFVVFICVSAQFHTPPSNISVEGHGTYSTVVETDEDAKEFVEQFSFVAEELYSLQEVYVPIYFGEVYTTYNEIQKKQGLDLEPYKGEKCKMYVYKLKDYEVENAQAYMSVIVYRERVIGGHISTMIEGSNSYSFYGE